MRNKDILALSQLGVIGKLMPCHPEFQCNPLIITLLQFCVIFKRAIPTIQASCYSNYPLEIFNHIRRTHNQHLYLTDSDLCLLKITRVGYESYCRSEGEMSYHRFAKFRISNCLLALLVSHQMVACSSGIEQGSSENTTLPTSLPAAINWVAPSEREDGTPLSLSEIAGYMIYYGASKGEYPSQIDINDNTAVQASLNS